MNKVIVSGQIVNHPIRYFKTKNGNKVLNNQIDVARNNTTYCDRINFTAWGELADLLTKANQDSIVELSGEWRVENFKDKKGNNIHKDILLVDKVDFAKIDIEEVTQSDIDELPLPNISEDDLPF